MLSTVASGRGASLRELQIDGVYLLLHLFVHWETELGSMQMVGQRLRKTTAIRAPMHPAATEPQRIVVVGLRGSQEKK